MTYIATYFYTATYFKGNPQSRNGGYNTTRIIEAKTLREATKKAEDLVNCVHGTMTLLNIKPKTKAEQNQYFMRMFHMKR